MKDYFEMNAERENFASPKVGDDDGKKIVHRTEEDNGFESEYEFEEGIMKRQLSRKLDLRFLWSISAQTGR